jgi:filamentous hemagglutinin family protein
MTYPALPPEQPVIQTTHFRQDTPTQDAQQSVIQHQLAAVAMHTGELSRPALPELVDFAPAAPAETGFAIAPASPAPTPPESLPVESRFLASTPTRSPVLLAQAITPAADGVGTTVTSEGNQFNIEGGQRSADGTNLFHSLSRFNLDAGQIANFLSQPQIRNILTRITGGEASMIDGRIQVTGGNSNLYLINPAGILFGANASLNVPAAFTATTANGIGFGSGRWFDAIAANDYTTLLGNPDALLFSAPQPGAIVNAGNLAVTTGQSLTLAGGTVLNTGQLSAPAGTITLVAVPGQSLLRLSQQGSPLSLEFPSPFAPSLSLPFSPLSLPQLLTGGNLGSATELTLNPDGSIQLTGSQVRVPTDTGTAIASGTITVSGQTGGTVNVLGTRIAVLEGNIDASGMNGGGTVRIGGDYRGGGDEGRGGGGDNASTPPLLSPSLNADRTLIDRTSTITANALQNGTGGRVTIWADETAGFYGSISARGGLASGNGGFVEVSGKQNLAFQGSVDVTAASGLAGTLLLDPANIIIQATGADDGQLAAGIPGAADPAGAIFAADGGGATFTLSASVLAAQPGNVILEATNDIAIAPGVSLSFAGGGTITFRADADNDGVGSFLMDATQSILASGRDIRISGANLAIGDINTANILPTSNTGGSVTLSARNTITTGSIFTSSSASNPGATATAGAIAITSSGNGDITTGQLIATAASPGPGQGGAIDLTSNLGNIAFNSIDTRALLPGGAGGNVRLIANGTVRGTGALAGNTVITSSPTTNGSITIQHDGGSANVPFTVGNSAVNGTTGALNAGAASTITPSSTPSSFPVLPNGGVTPGTPGGITIISVNQPPALSINPTLPNTLRNQPVTFTYADLTPTITDGNRDQTALVVTAVNRGTLTVNGNPVTAGTTTISPGDVLIYTPPANVVGVITNPFSLSATDGVSFSSPTSQIQITVSNPVNPGQINPEAGGLPDRSNTSTTSNLNNVLLAATPAAALAPGRLPCNSTDVGIYGLEDRFAREFEEYFGRQASNTRTQLLEACDAISQAETATGVKPAIIYVSFVPGALEAEQAAAPKNLEDTDAPLQAQPSPAIAASARDSDQLEIIAVTPGKRPIYRRVSGTRRSEVLQVVRHLTNEITDPVTRDTDSSLAAAQQLYQWIMQPIAAELESQKIDNLVFIMDAGLRSIPIAALHDGKQFLVENYSLALMPSLSLTDTRYQNIQGAQVLAMGASTFAEQRPLPAVPVELAGILNQPWRGETFLNQAFTLNNLKAQREKTPFGIVHLATHAEFNPGDPTNSYIQLWDTKLRLDQVRQLGWNNPPVQLLVLSACRTALGDEQAELGFAGLAYQTGVRSTLASLWAVDDAGTLAFMTEFYHQLSKAKTRSEALRQTQLAMIRGQVRVEPGQLHTSDRATPLPSELTQPEAKPLSYPFYWAAFTLVGNPW